MAQNNLINWITENPFYVLHVSCSDPRRKLSAAADEMSFLLSEDASADALGTLLNPSKRLSAEMDWFVDSEDAAIDAIREALEQGTALPDNGLHPISRLNAALYNIALSDQLDSLEIGFEITEIDRQFSDLSAAYVTEAVNQCRSAAQMTAITELDAEHALQEKRERIRRLIQSKLEMLDQDDYVELITIIAEKYVADSAYSDGVLLSDILDQYEIHTQTDMDSYSKDIQDRVEDIRHTIGNENDVRRKTDALTKQVKKWDRLAQPLQLKSQASGMPHKASVDMGYMLRDLCLFLNNEFKKPESALFLVDELRSVFAELADLSDLFRNDSEILKKISIGKKYTDRIDELEKEKDKHIQTMKDFPVLIYEGLEVFHIVHSNVSSGIESIMAQITEMNGDISSSKMDAGVASSLKERLCYIGRELAVSLHNEWHATKESLAIIRKLLTLFSTVDSLKKILEADAKTLESQLGGTAGTSRPVPSRNAGTITSSRSANTGHTPQKASSESADVKKTKVPVIIIAVLLIGAVIWGVMSNSADAGTTPSVMTGGQSSNQQAIEEDKETSFTNSSELYSDVYADINYIFPAYGVYKEGASNYDTFVCECHTTAGATIWLEISVSDYRLYFDSDASSAIIDRAADEIELPTTRIHGWVASADSVVSGLSDEIHASKVISFDSCD